MASSKSYLEFVLDQLSGVPEINWRGMMGEYLLYCRGRLFGGIYDDRFLVKQTPASNRMLPEAEAEAPYDGAKPMLRVDRVEEREFLAALVEAMVPELPAPKKPKGGRSV